MKTYIELDKFTKDINIIEVADDIELKETTFNYYIHLDEGKSKLAIRYGYTDDNKITDICSKLSDNELIEVLKSNEK